MFSSILAFTSSIFPGISSVSSSVIHERTSSSSSISPLKIKGSLFLKKAKVGKVLIPCFFAKPMSSVVTKMMPVSSSSSSIFSNSLRILSHSSPSSQSPPDKSYLKNLSNKIHPNKYPNIITRIEITYWRMRRRIHVPRSDRPVSRPWLPRWWQCSFARSAIREPRPRSTDRPRRWPGSCSRSKPESEGDRYRIPSPRRRCPYEWSRYLPSPARRQCSPTRSGCVCPACRPCRLRKGINSCLVFARDRPTAPT